MPRFGPDISHHQKTVNLTRAKPHVDFVFLKATDGIVIDGAMFVDQTFKPRWQQLAELGIPRGAYHYARPNSSPATQAAHFISVVRQNEFRSGDATILDMEDVKASKGMSASDLRAWVKRWVADVRQALDLREVIFYTGIPYWTGRMGDPPRLPTGCIGMVARYHKRGPYVRPLRRPAAWPDPPAIWQFTDGTNGRVTNIPGIGKVDCSEMTETAFDAVFGHEEDDFMALFKNVNEFKAAVRAVVKDEVKDEVDRIYKALARGEIDGQVVATSTHFQDSNRGLSRHIHDEVDRIYRALARGEVDGQVVATSTHFQDSNRHLAKLLEDIAARLPESTPRP
jgi:hypothetical protein